MPLATAAPLPAVAPPAIAAPAPLERAYAVANPQPLPPLRLAAYNDPTPTDPTPSDPAPAPLAPPADIQNALPMPAGDRVQNLTIDGALALAIAHNPDLAVAQYERSIAGAQAITADTYPYNPMLETQIQSANNPGTGLAQHIRQSYSALEEIELGHKGEYRRGVASAQARKTSWELAQQQLDVRADVYRKFQALRFARERLALASQTAGINRHWADNAPQLLNAGKLTPGDVIVSDAEAADSDQVVASVQLEISAAQADLKATLGLDDQTELVPQGEIDLPPVDVTGLPQANLPAGAPSGLTPLNESAALEQIALDALPELQAKTAALQQANAAVQLACANQRVNVTAGPAVEVDENKTLFVGATVQVPLQIFNRHEGELLQAEAERAKAAADLEQSRLKIKIRVRAAYQAWLAARLLADRLERDVVPQSEKRARDAEQLVDAGQLDLLKLVEILRRHVQVREQLIEAQNQATLRHIELDALIGRLINATRPIPPAPQESLPPSAPLPAPPAGKPG